MKTFISHGLSSLNLPQQLSLLNFDGEVTSRPEAIDAPCSGTVISDGEFFGQHFQSRVIEFKQQLSYENRLRTADWNGVVGNLWHEVFESATVSPRGKIIEIAPGSQGKIGRALQKMDFCGELYVVEPQNDALEKVLESYAQVLPRADLIGLNMTLAEAVQYLPKHADALVSNNPLDDFIVGKSMAEAEFQDFFSKCYGSDAQSASALWRMLEQNPSLLNQIVSAVESEWIHAIECLNPAMVGLSQYESNFYRLRSVRFPDKPSFDCLTRIGMHFGKTKFAQFEFSPPGGGIYDPNRWLVLKKSQSAAGSVVPVQAKIQSADSPKIRLAQIEVVPHDIKGNLTKILAAIESAKKDNRDLIVFPEMAVSGYLLGDVWENAAFVEELMKLNDQIKRASNGIAVIWGNVFSDLKSLGPDGNLLKYNAAYVAQNGEWVSNGVFEGKTLKTLLPNYRIYNDGRHFVSLRDFANEQNLSMSEVLRPFELVLSGRQVKFGLALGEDKWDEHYSIHPIQTLIDNGAETIIVISNSPWTWQKDRVRQNLAAKHIQYGAMPFIDCNPIGLHNQGNLFQVSDGRSRIYNSDGTISATLPAFEEGVLDADLFSANSIDGNPNLFDRENDVQDRFDALIYGIRHFMALSPFKKVLIGVSGGIDSSVTTALAAMALGAENVLGVTMPYERFTSSRTLQLARLVAANFGISFSEVSVKDTIDQKVQMMAGVQFTGIKSPSPKTVDQLSYENIQARARGDVLMSLSSMYGALILNTANKTEIAYGYGAQHGNWIGAITPLGDLYKTEIYELARFINKRLGFVAIPQETIDMVPTTELSDNQSHPFHYDYHDKLLAAWIEFNRDPRQAKDPYHILKSYSEDQLDQELGLPVGTVHSYFNTAQEFIVDLEDKWLRFQRTIYKKQLTPHIFVLSRRSLVDLVLSQVFNVREDLFSSQYRELKLKMTNDTSPKKNPSQLR